MKIRCSAIGKIMTSPKTKGEVLSQTTKTYIQGLALAHVYGIRKEFTSKYTVEKLKDSFDLTDVQVNSLLLIPVI